MSTPGLEHLLDRSPSIGLDELNDVAQLLTRKDRKYLVTPGQLTDVLDSVPAEMKVLCIEGSRWFNYESLYFDTPGLDSYRLAATRRNSRFKVRARTYLQSGDTMVEVKTKDRRGRTVKHREAYSHEAGSLTDAARRFAKEFDPVSPYAAELVPLLTSVYQRATVVFPNSGFRATIDASFGAVGEGGIATLDDHLILETKTSGKPSILDRELWKHGIRPVKISKYATGLAALRPDLPANRWHRVLKQLSVEPQLSPQPHH